MENYGHFRENKQKPKEKDKQKKPNQLEILGPGKWHSGEFSGFSFCLIHLILGGGEAINLEMPKTQTVKAPPPPTLLSLSKGPGKGQSSKVENF